MSDKPLISSLCIQKIEDFCNATNTLSAKRQVELENRFAILYALLVVLVIQFGFTKLITEQRYAQSLTRLHNAFAL